jgi:hypothetical protein
VPSTHAWLSHATVPVHADSVPSGRQLKSPSAQSVPAGVPPSSLVLHASGCPGKMLGSWSLQSSPFAMATPVVDLQPYAG